jgi:hypothetical protein
MVELKPFEGVGNRTSIIILQKGKKTRYPVPYNYWVKKVKGVGIKDSLQLEDVTKIATYKKFYAEPVDENDLTSSWITGRSRAIKAVKKVLGKSDYVAHEGVNTGGANGVYWVEIVDKRQDGLVIVSNITKGAKRKVESVQSAIEPDLLYPLLRGRDVKRWKAEPSAHILITHLPGMRLNAISEDEMKMDYPKTYMYLKRFEKALRERRGWEVKRMLKAGRPFYSMSEIGDYTFAPYKVVWREQASSLTATAVGSIENKCIVPDHKLMLIDCDTQQEAYYLSGMLNSILARYAAISYAISIQFDPHVLENIRIPKFDETCSLHLLLSKLSYEAHKAKEVGDETRLKEIEEEIDEVSCKIWQIDDSELKEIKQSLKEIR